MGDSSVPVWRVTSSCRLGDSDGVSDHVNYWMRRPTPAVEAYELDGDAVQVGGHLQRTPCPFKPFKRAFGSAHALRRHAGPSQSRVCEIERRTGSTGQQARRCRPWNLKVILPGRTGGIVGAGCESS